MKSTKCESKTKKKIQLHRPSIKGTKTTFKAIKIIIIISGIEIEIADAKVLGLFSN